MSNGAMSRKDGKRFLELGRQAFLNEFPNPERKGCPGSRVLKLVAAGKMNGAEEDRWIDHCASCSPCYGDLDKFRRAFMRQRRVRLVSVAAILIAVICVGTWLAINRHARRSSGTTIAANAQTESTIQNAMLDLRGWSAVRSDEAAPNNPSGKRLELHRGLLALTIYLPMGSRPGRYEIEIRRSQGKPLSKLEGTARIDNGNTVLGSQVDLRTLQPGQCSLGIRQPPSEWRYYPFTLR